MSVQEAVTLIAALTAAVVSTVGALTAWRNAGQLNAVHTIVNSQATKFEALAQKAGFAEGTAASVGSLPTPKSIP